MVWAADAITHKYVHPHSNTDITGHEQHGLLAVVKLSHVNAVTSYQRVLYHSEASYIELLSTFIHRNNRTWTTCIAVIKKRHVNTVTTWFVCLRSLLHCNLVSVYTHTHTDRNICCIRKVTWCRMHCQVGTFFGILERNIHLTYIKTHHVCSNGMSKSVTNYQNTCNLYHLKVEYSGRT